MSQNHQDKHFMTLALAEAQKAYDRAEVPVGAVLVYQGEVIAKAHNQVMTQQDVTAHAEILVLREASKVLNNYRLLDTTLYSSLEPCAMCAGALVHARIQRLVVATLDERFGACQSAFNLIDGTKLNHQIELSVGIEGEASRALLKSFFKARRQKAKG